MISCTPKARKNITVTATLTAVTALAATIFAPAGFGSRPRIALWADQPIIFAVPATAAPGSAFNCAVQFEDGEQSDDPTGVHAPAATSNTVTVYSDPPGVVSYNGTVEGSTAVLPATVSASAAPGPVTVYVETDGSTTVSATTTVTGG